MSRFNTAKKAISLFVLLAMMLSLAATAWAAPSSSDDLKGHWAETALRKWVEEGTLKGYNNQYHPNQPITRAEFMTLINRSFKLTESTDIKFLDLETSHWAYGQAAIASKAGYIKGYADQTIRPNRPVSREEAASMLAALLKLNSADLEGLKPIKDAATLSSWSKKAVAALVKEGILTGNSKGNFEPQRELSRAEAVSLLDKARNYAPPATVYDKVGTYGPTTGLATIAGDVVVSAGGITLQNIVIEGDLTISEAVGEGDAFFKNVTVKGTTTISGGGPNSVHFEDSVLVRVSIDKRDGTVRVLVIGDTTVQHVVVHSPVKLEESSTSDSGFKNVEIADTLPSGSNVQLIGQFENVSVLSSDIKVSIPSGSVKTLNIGEGAGNTTIDVSANATISDLVLNAVAKLLGQGTVSNATVNSGATGSSFEKRPTNVGGEASGSITTTNAGASGNTGGGNTGGGNTGGGNTGGGNTGGGSTPSCTEAPDVCRDATLSNLTVSGFTLNQLDSNFAATGSTGFNPDVFAYSIVAARTMEPVTATVSVTKSTYSTASYTIWGNVSKHLESGSLTDVNSSLQLEVKPMQDSRVVINVKSGDGISTKSYQIFFQYPRTLQEGLKIGSLTWSTFQDGQWIEQNSYHIQKGSINGEKLIDTDTLLLYNPGETAPFLTCTYYSCRIPDESITGTAGTWDVKITRNGTTLAQGEYRYDLSIVPVLTGDIGLEAIPLTTQELIDALRNEPGLTTPLRFGYNVFVDSAKLQAVVPGAKYYNIGAQDMVGTVSAFPEGLSKEDYKVGIQPNGYHGYSMSQAHSFSFSNPNAKQQIYGAYYHRSDSPDEDKSINDMFVYVGIYDENLQLLGQFITTLTFDQAHVADGYTPTGNWVPSQP